jgi:hypothetical protein
MAVIVLAALVSCLVLVSSAAAALPNFSWSGQSELTEEWSAGINWAGGTAPSAHESIGTLTFPRLTNTACVNETGAEPCYISYNDLSGLSAEGIELDDADFYLIGGNPLALGNGGLTAAPNAASTGEYAIWDLPLELSASQKWSDVGQTGAAIGETGLLMTPEAPVTGAGDTLGIEVANESGLYLDNNTEVGPVTIEGANPNQAGVFNGFVGLAGTLNATNKEPVHVSHILLLGTGTLGKLESTGATVNIGAGGEGAPAGIQVASAHLDSQSALHFEVAAAGEVAGSGYSHLTSTGSIELGGATIGVRVRRGCPTLKAGETLTFVSTAGGLSGNFANAPEAGPEIPIEFPPESPCESRSQKIKIRYHETGGTETVTGTVEAAAAEGAEETEREVKERSEREAKERSEREGRERSERELKEKAEREPSERLAVEAAERIGREVTERELAERHRHEEEAAAGGVADFKVAVSPDAKLASTSLKVNKAGAFTIKVSCPKGVSNCKGTVTLRTLGASGAAFDSAITTLASGSFSVAGGRSKTVVLHLSGKGRALLRAKRSLRARATIIAHDTAGGSHTTLALVTLHGLGHG